MTLNGRSAIEAVLTDVFRRGETVARAGRWEMGIVGEVERAGELGRILSSEPSLAEFSGGFMRSDGTGSSVLSMTSLIAWLIQRTLSVGASETVAELEHYITSASMPYRFLLGIRGVAVTEPSELSDGISIQPPLPEILRFESRDGRPTSAVLELRDSLPKVVTAAHNADSRDPSRTVAERAFERLRLAQACIALAIDAPIVETTRTTIQAESVPPTAGASASTAIGTMGLTVRNVDPHTQVRIGEIHAGFGRLPLNIHDRLAIAAHRWNGSLRRGATPDLFIDIGIGLECVYLSDGAGELKHRMTIRAGRLLATGLAERIHVANVIDALYETRSQAVHTGRLPVKIRRNVATDIHELARVGQQILRRSILVMIARGRDDWDEVLFG